MKQLIVWMLFLTTVSAGEAMALSQPEALENATRLRNALVDAINQKDYEHFVSLCHPELKLILSNGQIFNSTVDLQNFIRSPDIVGGLAIDSLKINEVEINKNYVEIDSKQLIVTGRALFEYRFKRDKTFIIPTIWLAHMIKNNETWQLLSYQNTVNVTQNPIITDLKSNFYFIGMVVFILGMIFGILWKKIKKRR